jgi:sialate O-acetylesterase
MIHPLAPFAIRGITWYQGEQNYGDGMLYFDKMQALIQSWRNVFLRPDAPFYFVQIAPYRYGGGKEQTLPELWEAQTAALDIPRTGMAVISDVGHVQDIHPRNKQDVGKRLALWALAKDYGQEDLVHSGPLYKSMAIEGSKIRLSFDHTGSGLASRDDKPLDWFEIAGKDGKFVKAQATIDGDTVLVSSDEIAKPTAARFAWHQEGVPNLMNKEGLPAGPFRTHRPKKSKPKKSKPKKDLTAFAQPPAHDFDKTIAPLLADKCMSCHSGADPKGALDLSSQAMAMKGGENR